MVKQCSLHFYESGEAINKIMEKTFATQMQILYLTQISFLPNNKKPIWEPYKILTWLDVEIDLTWDVLKI